MKLALLPLYWFQDNHVCPRWPLVGLTDRSARCCHWNMGVLERSLKQNWQVDIRAPGLSRGLQPVISLLFSPVQSSPFLLSKFVSRFPRSPSLLQAYNTLHSFPSSQITHCHSVINMRISLKEPLKSNECYCWTFRLQCFDLGPISVTQITKSRFRPSASWV